MWLLWIGLAWSQGVPDAVQTLPTASVFSTGEPSLTAEGEELVLAWLRSLEAAPQVEFEVSAHTNSQGSDAHNQNLSQLRAEAAMRALVAGGAEPKRLRARGYGETVPIATNQTAEGRSANSRLELRRLDGAPLLPQPAPYSGPETWSGINLRVTGVFRSGDETRDGPLLVDRAIFEAPFSGEIRTHAYSTGDAVPTFRFVSPSGVAHPVASGNGVVELQKGTWVVEARTKKKGKGAWAVQISGVGPEPPGPGAPMCAVLSYLAAEVVVHMEGAKGVRVDDDYYEAIGVPGLNGTSKILDGHVKYELVLYDGDDAVAAASAWDIADAGLSDCWRSPKWGRSETPWEQQESMLSKEATWRERTVDFELSGPYPVVGKLKHLDSPNLGNSVRLMLMLGD